MATTHQDLIDNFFHAYSQRDMTGIRQVMAENVIWSFLGQHKLAGTKKGIDEVIAFFDTMGGIMSDSRPAIDKLIIASNEKYLIECQHIKTHRVDGINIEHDVCVLWEIENDKIVSGRHFFADPKSVDAYFNAVPLGIDKLVGFTPLVVEQVYDASLSKVWKAITDETQMREWYFETMTTFKPLVGFETEFNVPSNDKDYLHIWKVTEVIPEESISYNWKFGGYSGESLVTFELSKADKMTKLKLTETGIESFPQDNPDFTRESWTEGWNYFICDRLKEFLEKAY